MVINKITNLTNKFIDDLLPQRHVFLVFDAMEERLCIEVRPDGRKLWLLVADSEGRETMKELGRFPETQAEDAKVKARAAKLSSTN